MRAAAAAGGGAREGGSGSVAAVVARAHCCTAPAGSFKFLSLWIYASTEPSFVHKL